MIITELLTNAYKSAYPSEAEGEVRLRLKRMDEKTALIAVEDDGLGWKGTGDIQGTGIGSRIVQSMARSLGTALAYDDLPRGTRAHMTISGDL
jgi:two-component sensor histidine kinase